MKYRMTKRLLAALLCACLLVTSLPLQALAAVDVTKGNSTQENAQLLQQLEALTGGESEAAAALATMRDLGPGGRKRQPAADQNRHLGRPGDDPGPGARLSGNL